MKEGRGRRGRGERGREDEGGGGGGEKEGKWERGGREGHIKLQSQAFLSSFFLRRGSERKAW